MASPSARGRGFEATIARAQRARQPAAALAATLALIGGALMLLAAGLLAGVVADFLSKPVLVGYMTGAALILMSTQLGKLFGLKIEGHEFFPIRAELIRRLGETHGLTLALGIGPITLLALLERFAPTVPGALVVFVLGLLASALLVVTAGVLVVGVVPGILIGVMISVERIGLMDRIGATSFFPSGHRAIEAFQAASPGGDGGDDRPGTADRTDSRFGTP